MLQASRPDSKLLAGRVTKHLLAAATECQLIGTRTSYLQHMTSMLCELKAPSAPPHHPSKPCEMTAQLPGTLATAAGFAHSVAKIHSIAANDAASVMNLLEFWAAGQHPLCLIHFLSRALSHPVSSSHSVSCSVSLSSAHSVSCSVSVSSAHSLSSAHSCTCCYDEIKGSIHMLILRFTLLLFLALSLIHTHSLSPVLVVMMKSKELKTKIYSHAHSLIHSLTLSDSLSDCSVCR